MIISLLGQNTRQVDTNDGDVPPDDLIPAKSQNARVKSGDGAERFGDATLQRCFHVAKVGQAFAKIGHSFVRRGVPLQFFC